MTKTRTTDSHESTAQASSNYRANLLMLVERLGITDQEAGESEWAAYLTADQLAEAIIELRPDHRITAGNGDDREAGVLDGFEDHMAVIRWDSGVVTPCPVEDIDDEDAP